MKNKFLARSLNFYLNILLRQIQNINSVISKLILVIKFNSELDFRNKKSLFSSQLIQLQSTKVISQNNKKMDTNTMEKITDDFYVDKSKILGKGNFGVVYKGYWISENKIIAVKFMDRQMLKKFPDYERQLIVMDDLSKLHHPNIMGYYGSEQNKDGLYCFIEFCNGGSLKDLIKKNISELKVMTLLKQLLQAMTYINKMNKVHRDLKPDNVLLDQNEQLKIADFGLARDVEIQMTKGACTPLYAAPEVINLRPYNERCDVWSAGLILFEMLTGHEFFEHVKTKKQLLSEIQKFNTGEAKINYPKSLHKQWQTITMAMLTYNHTKRPSFADLLQLFKQKYESMFKEISAKYGYDTPGFEDFDDGLRLTKTISPYQSKPVANKKQDMLKKLMEERSFTNVNNLRKFLTFYRYKIDLMNRLIKEFTNNTYSCLKNVYKYMLMYLSVAAFISRTIQHVKDLKNKKIQTPDGTLTENDFEDVHINEVRTLLKDFIAKHEVSMTKFRAVLEKQISSKITKSYMSRQEEKKVLVQNKIPDMIAQSNQGQFQRQQIYMNKYTNIMNNPNVYLTESALQTLSQGDLKVYFYIRLVGHIDKYIADLNYKNDDYMRVKKQQIENMTKSEMIENIKGFNKKN